MTDLHDRDGRGSDDAGQTSKPGVVSTGADIERDYDSEPVDFSLVHADDEFLDALGAAEPDTETLEDDRLSALLLSWRQDVDAEPIHDLIDNKFAVATVQAARIRHRRRPRIFAPLAAAAAVLAIAFAGVGLMARDAQPGDTLWGLTKVLYADHARSVEAAAAVHDSLRDAEEALAKGKVAEAKSMLDEAQHTLPTVSSEDGKADLQAKHDELVAKLPDKPVDGASPPPAAAPTTAPVPGTTDPVTSAPDTTVPTTPPTSDPATTTPTPTTTETPSEPGRIETEPGTPSGGTPKGEAPNGAAPNGDAPKAEPGTNPAGTNP